jgi:seryl-tRNA synthetase
VTHVNLQGKSFDARLVTEEPELIMAHLKARRASEQQLGSIQQIGGAWSGDNDAWYPGVAWPTHPSFAALNLRRKELVKQQQGALTQRKSLSAEIGKLMREKKAEEAEALKRQVEEANKVAAAAEEQLTQVTPTSLTHTHARTRMLG